MAKAIRFKDLERLVSTGPLVGAISMDVSTARDCENCDPPLRAS